MRHLLMVALVLSGCTLFGDNSNKDRKSEKDNQPIVETSEAVGEPRSGGEEAGEPGAGGEGGEGGPVGANLVDGGSCMECHNGSKLTDYAGSGLKNPHPFPGAANLTCTECHGGDPKAAGKVASHVPPPPQIGDKLKQINDPQAHFNRLTMIGIDKMPDYKVGDKSYTSLDYLQFINPGDMRIVTKDRGCGQGACHGTTHADWFSKAPINTQVGMFSAPFFLAGLPNAIDESKGLHEDTAADFSFRAIEDKDWEQPNSSVGRVSALKELPNNAKWGDLEGVFNNFLYRSELLNQSLYAAGENPLKVNSVKPGSAMDDLFKAQIDVTCGDCHAGSAGANNRYADFRSSGCTSCHMQYSPDGRSRSSDPNVDKTEPVNPDAIAAGERPHIYEHTIQSVKKELPNGEHVGPIRDTACAGCHQGSNRTVLQYWGIRLDQNQDLTNNFQYPAAPQKFEDTAKDARLFDATVGNATFNGRVPEQYIVHEDYDGDGRDDTPADVHYEAGMGCIDCHSGRELHGGTQGDETSGQLVSRRQQNVTISCESCHGAGAEYAETDDCTTYEGVDTQCVVDKMGNTLPHVNRNKDGEYWLKSRVTGDMHYVKQTKDVISDNGKTHPKTGQPVFNRKASFAMGRVDGKAETGIGPVQANAGANTGFSHMDDMDCATCHAAWQNNCMGCHLGVEYDGDPNNFNFSNITGERIAIKQFAADFVYQSPVMHYLGVNSEDKISTIQPMPMFWRYKDLEGTESEVFTFNDRKGKGNNPQISATPALGHYQLSAHSIRGKVTKTNEGPRYCVSCHLTEDGMNNFGAQYTQLRTALATNNFADIDFNLLAEHIGANPGNQLNSPLFVHAAVGLGSGLFLFDENGCPINPLDTNANRHYCQDGAPAENFDLDNVRYNLDRFVDEAGISTSPSIHPMSSGEPSRLRDGASNPEMAGPLGKTLIERLANPNTGIILDSWLDADGYLQGKSVDVIPGAASIKDGRPRNNNGNN